MPTTTPRGAPYPLGSDNNDGPGAFQALATWTQDRPGISVLTTTQRNALAGADLWTGRVVFNSTTGALEFYNGTAWTAVAAASSGVPILTTAQRNALSGANLYRGLTIFNSDTGAVEVYYGATTLWRPPWNTAWGLVTPIVNRNTSVITGGAAFVQCIASAAFTPLANRILSVSYNPVVSGGALTSTTMQVRRNIGGTVVGIFTLRRESASTAQSEAIILSESPGAGAVSYEVGFIAGATSTWSDLGSLYGTSQLVIHDVGPSGNAPAS